jgi:hypothetical protein
MRTKKRVVVSLVFALLTIALSILQVTTTLAAVPSTIMYQGRLTQPSGQAVVDGLYQIRFRIYPSAVGSSAVWDNGFRTVTVVSGLFSYRLGDSTAFPSTLFDNPPLWLGITVGSDAELSPRSELTGVAFAQRAAVADTARIVAWQNITGMPADIANGDSVGVGDITGLSAGEGLSGGGQSGDLSLSIASGGVTSDLISDGAVNLIDLNLSARPAASKTSLVSPARDCSAAPTPLDSFNVTVPAPGYLLVIVNGRYMYNVDATTTSSVTEQLNFGLDTLAGVMATNSFDFYHLDPDNASAANMVWPFTLSRFDPVQAGSKKYYINARSYIVGNNLTLYSGSHAIVMFVPSPLTVTK